MANVQKDLGPVSAYAIAVKHGYKGTEEEWAALQIAAAENAKTADEAAKAAAATLAAVGETVTQETNRAVEAIGKREAAAVEAMQDAAQAAGTQQEERIAAKGEATLAAIPDDYAALSNDVAALTQEMAIQAPAIVETATGNVVSITDGADKPAVSLVTHIEPVQEGEGDPSPDNVRPISGWDKARAQRAGKNLVPNNWEAGSLGINSDGNLALANNTSGVQRQTGILLKPGTYTVSGPEKAYIYIYTSDNKVNTALSVTTGVTTPYSFTTTRDYYLGLIAPAAYVNGDINNIKYQAEHGSTATTYEPYQGQTLTADLPETVYGGTLDWNTGVLVNGWMTKKISELAWKHSGNSDDPIFYLDNLSAKKKDGKIVCEAYKTVQDGLSVAGMPDATIKGHPNLYHVLYIRDNRYTNIDDFLAAMGDKLIALETGTQTTIQLTPQQLDLLKGVNNVWSDCGDTTLEYVADTEEWNKKAATSMIGAVETGMVATKNYAIGDFIIHKDGLTMYRATAAIAKGEAIKPGTNCKATTVVEQLANLYSLLS